MEREESCSFGDHPRGARARGLICERCWFEYIKQCIPQAERKKQEEAERTARKLTEQLPLFH